METTEKKQSFISIAQNISDIIDNLDVDENGEVVGIEALDEVQDNFNTKAEGIAQKCKEMAYLIGCIKEEESNLYSRRKSLEKKLDSIKQYITDCCDIAGVSKVKTALCEISFRKSESVSITDLDRVPAEYKRVKTTVEADKTALKKVLKDGIEIDGAVLVESKNIQIK